MATITETTKLMASNIVATIVAGMKENPNRSSDYMEEGDYREDKKGDWIKGRSSVWWSGYDPKEPSALHETWRRVTVMVPFGQRIARHALRLAMDIETQAAAIMEGPQAE